MPRFIAAPTVVPAAGPANTLSQRFGPVSCDCSAAARTITVLDISRLRPRPPHVPRSRVVITSAAQEQETFARPSKDV